LGLLVSSYDVARVGVVEVVNADSAVCLRYFPEFPSSFSLIFFPGCLSISLRLFCRLVRLFVFYMYGVFWCDWWLQAMQICGSQLFQLPTRLTFLFIPFPPSFSAFILYVKS